jgi:hypothetical protein
MGIYIDGKDYPLHLIIILLMTRSFPKSVTRHINGNRLDNRWSNLTWVGRKKDTDSVDPSEEATE